MAGHLLLAIPDSLEVGVVLDPLPDVRVVEDQFVQPVT